MQFKVYMSNGKGKRDPIDLTDPYKYEQSTWFGETLEDWGYELSDVKNNLLDGAVAVESTGVKDFKGQELYEGDIMISIKDKHSFVVDSKFDAEDLVDGVFKGYFKIGNVYEYE